MNQFESLQLQFDVITITKNCVQRITETLYSVSSQTYQNINHIIIDGNSCDETVNTINKFNHTKKITIYQQNGSGIANAFNIGLSKASGKLVVFLNAGDIFIDKYVIENIINSYFKNSWLWAFGETISVSRKGYLRRHIKQYTQWKQEFFLYGNPMCHQSTIFTKEILDTLGLYNELLPLGMDYDFNIRASLIEEPHLLRFPISYYETTGVSSMKVFQAYKAHSDIRKKYFMYTHQRNLQIDTIGFIKAMKRFLMIPLKLYL
ncbi:Glycosyl transferase, family 2 [Trichormus variabilis ATCC 29413]|uniref:Glycosyl transferase, family 2 n=3 Tax=Anabaena variabilis TaxID=264691 RepID=Q3MEC3_TRIV2|nr:MULTISPECIES: glycosyltransferase family 2 protein [Nostocaceae]ABA20663.1 Glycosyl transferase, family 2 [Trichormus variabilis ATCC 29413]MBC1215011.1 glycosyltransferase [Trichormus variabilis ARAD]MBC1300913.1 glycosyltransferase [Trichormus variabilis N2B]MBC1327424.1 glycosyltransferase [Trichormus variabilis 9RC]MBD2379921.1 glycosyltransferase [Trichormus variabilis FACHB-319]